ncbi:MAG: hypothetical protein ACLQPD_21175 [Desulfomonilaceae bacterium]
MTSDRQLPDPTEEYYRDRFKPFFEEFIREVLLKQADHYMAMVGFHRIDEDPLPQEPDENMGERAGGSVMVYGYQNNHEMEFEFRFFFHPFTGVEFNIDFEEAGMLIYSGPYGEVDSDVWESIMDTIEDGEDEILRRRERQRLTVVK